METLTSIPFFAMLIGLVLWFGFAERTPFPRPQLSELGRLTYFAALLIWLGKVAGKSLF